MASVNTFKLGLIGDVGYKITTLQDECSRCNELQGIQRKCEVDQGEVCTTLCDDCFEEVSCTDVNEYYVLNPTTGKWGFRLNEKDHPGDYIWTTPVPKLFCKLCHQAGSALKTKTKKAKKTDSDVDIVVGAGALKSSQETAQKRKRQSGANPKASKKRK